MIQFPILHTSSGDVRIEPVSASLDLELEPLSSAELELKPGESIPERSWVSVFNEHGLAGIFRSKPQKDRYGERSSHVSLVHGAVEMNDWLTGKSDQTQASAASAISAIFQSYGGSKWSLGTVSPSNSVVYELNNSGVLDAITEIMEQIPGYMITFDQSTTPWVMNVVARPSEVSAEGRLSRNISSVEISRDDSSLCTRVYYGDNGGYVQDSTAVSKYGIIEHRIGDSGFTAQQLATIAQTYLDNHKEPKLSVSISAIDLYAATGETLDRITLGSKYRLAIPEADSEENRIIEQVVCSIRYDDLFSSNPQITLASDPETIITFLKKQRKTGGRAVQQMKEDVKKQFRTYRVENDEKFETYAEVLGVVLDDDGNIVFDETTGKPVYDPDSTISIHSDQVQTATQTGSIIEAIGSINGTTVTLSQAKFLQTINNDLSTSTYIKSDIIQLDGDAVATSLAGTDIDVAHLDASQISAGELDVPNIGIYKGETEQGGSIIHQYNETTIGVGNTLSNGVSTPKYDLSLLIYNLPNNLESITYEDFPHYHTVTFSNGQFTIGGVTATAPAPFDITATTWFQDQVAAAYEDGWGEAFGKVSWPTSGTSNAYIDISAPISTVDGPADLKRFYIRNDPLNNDVAYISTLNSQNQTYTNYAMLNHGKYTAGQNSVTAILSSTTAPSGTQTLSDGDYGLFLKKNGVTENTPIAYYKVAGTQTSVSSVEIASRGFSTSGSVFTIPLTVNLTDGSSVSSSVSVRVNVTGWSSNTQKYNVYCFDSQYSSYNYAPSYGSYDFTPTNALNSVGFTTRTHNLSKDTAQEQYESYVRVVLSNGKEWSDTKYGSY